MMHPKNNTRINILLYAVVFLFVFFSPLSLKALPQEQEDLFRQQYGLNDDEIKQVEDILYSVFPSPEEIKENAMGDNLEIKILPKYPSAYENTTITTVSHLTDLNRAEFFWYLGDNLKEKGFGKTKFNFSTKKIGETSTVYIVIKTIEGYRVDKEIKITPVGLDVFWETEGYTPPFYKGKALASQESSIKLIAFPNFITPYGRQIPASELIYIWRKNNIKVEENSGYGKNIFYDKSPLVFGKNNIDVEVSSLDNSLKTLKRIQVGTVRPKVLFYENKPVDSVWYGNTIKNEFNLNRQEITVKAEPYFFAKSAVFAGDLKYKWSMNGVAIANDNKEVVFRQEEKSGTARIKVTVEDVKKRLKSIGKSFVVNFRSAGLFDF